MRRGTEANTNPDGDGARTLAARTLAACAALTLICLLALLPGRAQAAYEWVRESPVPDEASGIAVGTGSLYITQGHTALDEPSIQRYSLRGNSSLSGATSAPIRASSPTRARSISTPPGASGS